jgi:putative ABC transport system substrate-binding protein
VAVLRNPDNPDSELDFRATEVAASALGLRLQSLEVRSVADVLGAFGTTSGGQPEALVTFSDPLTLVERGRILRFALNHRLPTMFDRKQFVQQGGLMSYGPDPIDSWRRAARYVDRILKGARPADLPVEQPSKFDFAINRRTAQLLKWTIPESVRLQVTEFIE